MSDLALIIYDGECIFCQNYVRLLRLREKVGKVELLDARSADSRVAQYWRKGYDLNEGLLFAYNGGVYYGSDAVHALAILSNPVSRFNFLNRAIFSHKPVSILLYPVLKAGRRLTLWARGRKLMVNPNTGAGDD
jgi:predicted DCC family thiol-disulfide oxidoreductase YuxK